MKIEHGTWLGQKQYGLSNKIPSVQLLARSNYCCRRNAPPATDGAAASYCGIATVRRLGPCHDAAAARSALGLLQAIPFLVWGSRPHRTSSWWASGGCLHCERVGHAIVSIPESTMSSISSKASGAGPPSLCVPPNERVGHLHPMVCEEAQAAPTASRLGA